MPPKQLIDPMWHWLRASLGQLYTELDSGVRDISLVLTVRYDDGSLVAYSLTPGVNQVIRNVVTDGEVILQAFSEATIQADIDHS